MLRLVNDIKSVSKRKPKHKVSLNYLYQSDFSSGADGFVNVTGASALDGNIDGIGGLDDVLRVTCEVAAGKSGVTTIAKTIASPDTIVGEDYRLNFKYFIPSANDEILFIEQIVVGGATGAVDSGAVATDDWHSKSVEITATSANRIFGLFLNADHSSGVEDIIYIKDVELIKL